MTDKFQTLFANSYEYVYVDMGIRNRNLDIAAQFGVNVVHDWAVGVDRDARTVALADV